MKAYDLERFVTVQSEVYQHVLQELRREKKQTHWIWFIFPQIVGLGSSETAKYFAIGSAGEAQSYLAHHLLGGRLKEMTHLMNEARSDNAVAILGAVDTLKFHSSMTLFNSIDPDEKAFSLALNKFFRGKRDKLTVQILGNMII